MWTEEDGPGLPSGLLKSRTPTSRQHQGTRAPGMLSSKVGPRYLWEEKKTAEIDCVDFISKETLLREAGLG